jgi:hypothetical protein
MVLRNRLLRVSMALAGLSSLFFLSAGAGPADAAVYCKTVGVPRGCIVRPAVPRTVVVAPAVVVAPVIVAPVVVAPRVGVRAVGVGRVGVPGNRGGPVNRVGRR